MPPTRWWWHTNTMVQCKCRNSSRCIIGCSVSLISTWDVEREIQLFAVTGRDSEQWVDCFYLVLQFFLKQELLLNQVRRKSFTGRFLRRNSEFPAGVWPLSGPERGTCEVVFWSRGQGGTSANPSCALHTWWTVASWWWDWKSYHLACRIRHTGPITAHWRWVHKYISFFVLLIILDNRWCWCSPASGHPFSWLWRGRCLLAIFVGKLWQNPPGRRWPISDLNSKPWRCDHVVAGVCCS